ncbi:MAG: sugar phosphate isomerase/epimerase [Chloroflexi bacterium]|nr:sugar phosphate isomerase/epimerase [Chloroflexota bacterium]
MAALFPIERLEIFTNCYGHFGVAAAIEHVPTIGVTALEVALKPHGGLLEIPESVVASEKMSAAAVAGLKAKLAERGVRPTTANGLQRIMTAEGFETSKARINLAQQLGTRVMTGSADNVPEEQRNALYDRLLQLADYAGERGITFALETHPGIAQNAEAIRRAMRDLNHPRIRINFDTANIYYHNEGMQDGEAELERVAEYVVHLHLKDCRRGYHDWHFPALGEAGGVDFTRVGSILESSGFQGQMSIELEGIKGEPELTLEERQARVARSVAYLRSVGFVG